MTTASSSTSSAPRPDPRLVRVLTAQYRAWLKSPTPYFVAAQDEANVLHWTVLVAGLGAPFAGGEFIFTFEAPPEFPHKPPVNLCAHTPNGVFLLGGRICISAGEFHGDAKGETSRTDTWRPSLGMAGFAGCVVNSLICHESLKGGVRIAEVLDPAAMARFAAASRAFNAERNRQLYARLEGVISSHPDLEPVKLLMSVRSKLGSSNARTGDTAQGAAAAAADTASPFVPAGARNASLSYAPGAAPRAASVW